MIIGLTPHWLQRKRKCATHFSGRERRKIEWLRLRPGLGQRSAMKLHFPVRKAGDAIRADDECRTPTIDRDAFFALRLIQSVVLISSSTFCATISTLSLCASIRTLPEAAMSLMPSRCTNTEKLLRTLARNDLPVATPTLPPVVSARFSAARDMRAAGSSGLNTHRTRQRQVRFRKFGERVALRFHATANRIVLRP